MRRAGAGLGLRCATGSSPRPTIVAQADLFFTGGLVPQTPVIYDEKSAIEPNFGNFNLTLGINLGF